MSKEPEIGQLVFGNPAGSYGTPRFADALIDDILSEIGRIYWNREQKEWNRHDDPKIEGMEFRPYDWSENEETMALPNLKFAFSPQEIRWYKHPGRGQSCSLGWIPAQWAEWHEEALKVVCAADELAF